MNLTRRNVLQVGTASSMMSVLGRALAFGPLESTSLVCGFAPGGTSDTVCRRVGASLSKSYAKTAVTENRSGAGGQIAISYVKGKPADGSTILMTPTSMLSIYPHIYRTLPYDPIADLTPVSLACVFNYCFAVGPNVPASVNSVRTFLSWAKEDPARANYGSPGTGTTAHFIGTMLARDSGIALSHAAYRGTQPAMLDLLGGTVSAVIGPIGDVSQHLATGKVRILGVSAEKRSRFAPAVPTLEEQGFMNMTHREWFAFFLPAHAPADLVGRLNADLRTALATQTVVDGLATYGLEAMASGSAELGDLIKVDLAKWGPIVKEVGFSVQS